MLNEDSPFTHIQREIEVRQAPGRRVPVSKKNIRAAPKGATAPAAASVSKTRAKTGAAGAAAAAAAVKTAARGAAPASRSAARGSASTSSTSTTTAASNKRSGRESGEADVSSSSDVQRCLAEQFAKYSPQLHHGDFSGVVDQNIADWEGKFTLLMLDPPFGILDGAEHDVKIPAVDILRQCSRLLKPQGILSNSLCNACSCTRYK